MTVMISSSTLTTLVALVMLVFAVVFFLSICKQMRRITVPYQADLEASRAAAQADREDVAGA